MPGGDKGPDSRIAVVYYKLNAYLFIGELSDQQAATEQKTFAEVDKQFVAAINTFRPISSREIAGQKPKTIRYVKATSATTFDKLSKALNLNAVDREDLRIINGYYPSGEPKAGDWIKIFKQ